MAGYFLDRPQVPWWWNYLWVSVLHFPLTALCSGRSPLTASSSCCRPFHKVVSLRIGKVGPHLPPLALLPRPHCQTAVSLTGVRSSRKLPSLWSQLLGSTAFGASSPSALALLCCLLSHSPCWQVCLVPYPKTFVTADVFLKN